MNTVLKERGDRIFLWAGFAIYAVATLWICVRSGPLFDYNIYVEMWDAYLRGLDPWYSNPESGYPPGYLLLAYPWALYGLAPKIIFWASAMGILVIAGRRLVSSTGSFRSLVLLFLLAFHPYFFFFTFLLGTGDALVVFLFLLACELRGRKDFLAGVCLGFSIGLKLYPAAALPVLGFDREQRRLRAGFCAGVALPLVLIFAFFGLKFPGSIHLHVLHGLQYEPEILSVFRPIDRFLLPGFSSHFRVETYLFAAVLLLAVAVVAHWRGTAEVMACAFCTAILFMVHPSGHVQYWLMMVASIFLYWISNKPSPAALCLLIAYSCWLGLVVSYYGAHYYWEGARVFPDFMDFWLHRRIVSIPHTIFTLIFTGAGLFLFREPAPRA